MTTVMKGPDDVFVNMTRPIRSDLGGAANDTSDLFWMKTRIYTHTLRIRRSIAQWPIDCIHSHPA